MLLKDAVSNEFHVFSGNGINDELAVEKQLIEDSQDNLDPCRAVLVGGRSNPLDRLAGGFASWLNFFSLRYLAIRNCSGCRVREGIREGICEDSERRWRCGFQSLGLEARSGLQSQPVRRRNSATRSSRDREDADSGSRI